MSSDEASLAPRRITLELLPDDVLHNIAFELADTKVYGDLGISELLYPDALQHITCVSKRLRAVFRPYYFREITTIYGHDEALFFLRHVREDSSLAPLVERLSWFPPAGVGLQNVVKAPFNLRHLDLQLYSLPESDDFTLDKFVTDWIATMPKLQSFGLCGEERRQSTFQDNTFQMNVAVPGLRKLSIDSFIDPEPFIGMSNLRELNLGAHIPASSANGWVDVCLEVLPKLRILRVPVYLVSLLLDGLALKGAGWRTGLHSLSLTYRLRDFSEDDHLPSSWMRDASMLLHIFSAVRFFAIEMTPRDWGPNPSQPSPGHELDPNHAVISLSLNFRLYSIQASDPTQTSHLHRLFIAWLELFPSLAHLNITKWREPHTLDVKQPSDAELARDSPLLVALVAFAETTKVLSIKAIGSWWHRQTSQERFVRESFSYW